MTSSTAPTDSPAPPSFLDYTPVALAFGTSGLRGLVKDITDLEAYINVKGTLRYLSTVGDLHAPSTVVLAGDLRPSTERILYACAKAILDCDCQVEYGGRIPTPALVLRSLTTHRAGVMVTGSHIPFDRNGIKINRSAGEILKADEPGILREINRVRAEEYGRDAASSAFDAHGMLKERIELPPINGAAEAGYVQRYLDFFAPGSLSNLNVVFYQHSAVGRDLLPKILRALGAGVSEGGRAETFVPIDTENITAEQLDRLEELAVEAERDGRTMVAVVSTDGDSDRPLIAAVRSPSETPANEKRVRFLPGDLVGIVVTEFLGAGAAVVPISANDAVEQRMKELGITLKKSRVGSPYVIADMDAIRSAEPSTQAPKSIVGWEANGGFLLGSAVSLRGRELAALPTRDALLPILVNLQAAANSGTSLSALWDQLPARFGRAGLIDEMPVAASKAILSHLIPSNHKADTDGEVPIDAPLKSLLQRFFTPADGFDDPVSLNVLDGARVRFANGDVAHIRPSGNAPQLRAYSNSGSQARADRIVEVMLREPDGILRRMQKELL